VHRKADFHKTLSDVTSCKASCATKVSSLTSLLSTIELGFAPALERMRLEEERLTSEIARRRLLTETMIVDKIANLQAPVKQQLKLVEQQRAGIDSCAEIVKSALGLDPQQLIRAYPRVELEARQVLAAYQHLERIEEVKVEAVTPDMYPRSFLDGAAR
jgi:hypothetical protein